MYKDSTIDKINNLKLNQTMRLGRCTIKCVHHIASCKDCIFDNKSKICMEIKDCMGKTYIKL